MTYSMQVGKYKLMFSDTHFKDFCKKPTISVYDAERNSEIKIASFVNQDTFEWFIEEVAEQTEPNLIADTVKKEWKSWTSVGREQTEPTTEDCLMVEKINSIEKRVGKSIADMSKTDCPWK